MSADNRRSEALLRRTMTTVDALQQRLRQRIGAENEPIAVVGVGCRFPGIEGPQAFADFLARGDSAVGPLVTERAAAPAGPETPRYRVGGFFEDIASFDADAFGVNAEQAQAMDPQLRLLLEVSREAIVDAGLNQEQIAGSRCAVMLALGAQNSDYQSALANVHGGSTDLITGSFHSLMPGRLSYHFDLRGPSFVVDAACASSLVAVDLACQALRRGECDRVIVAAVNLVLSDVVSAAIDRAGLWSDSGSCRSFDEGADGFVRGEGAVVLVLRRRSDALRDSDPIRALILAAASGQDGRGNGLAAPNGPAQSAVMRRALEQAKVTPAQVAWVEAHATGTRLGDAIEVEAIDEIYGADQSRTEPLRVGALKPALGHLEAASGLAALLKAILARGDDQIPPTKRPLQLNREIATLGERIEFPNAPTDWPQAAPYAAVSAFGMSGTNAHVIIGPRPVAAIQTPKPLPSLTTASRRRYWPNFVATERFPANFNGLLYEQVWEPLDHPFNELPKRLRIAGDARLIARLAPALAAAGVEILDHQSDLPSSCRDPFLFVIGSAFADLAAVQDSLKTLTQFADPGRLLLVAEGGSAKNVLSAAMLGLGRGIAAEHPELGLRIIDIQPGQADPGAALLRALCANSSEPMLRVTNLETAVPRLQRIDVAPGQFVPDPQSSHLVTGAFGGIGRAVSRWLAQRGARHLVLLGRNPRALPEQSEFDALGVQLTVVQADVADRAALERVFEQAQTQGRPVVSVFHIAGVMSNELLVRQGAEEFAYPFRAKLLGASMLDAVTRSRRLDAFVLFSSITAFVPLAGAAAYASANASLAAIARSRRAKSLPALCVHWGTWADSGMVEAAGATLAARWQEHGIRTMSARQALAALEAMIAADISEAIAADMDWTKIAHHAEREASGIALFSKLRPVAADQITTAANKPIDDADLPSIIRAALSRTLKVDATLVNLDAPFGDLGVDSMAAVELRNELSSRLGLRLPASLAFNYPSTHALSAALAQRLRHTSSERNPSS